MFLIDYILPDGIRPNGAEAVKACFGNLLWPNVNKTMNEPFLHDWFDYPVLPTGCLNLSATRQKLLYELNLYGGVENWGGAPITQHEHMFQFVPEKVLDAARHGQCLIIANHSQEGHPPVGWRIVEAIRRGISAAKLPTSSILYLTGDLFRSRRDEYGFASLSVEFFKVYTRNSMHGKPHLFVDDSMLLKQKSKHYICLNRVARPHRIGLLAELHHRDLLQYGHVSLGPDFPMGDCHVEAHKIAELRKLAPFILDHADFDRNWFMDNPVWAFEDSIFHIVNETLFDPAGEPTLFFSEKVWKPITNLQPFIFVGQAGGLKRLKDEGYKTFSSLIDESYDLEFDPNRRLMMVADQIEKICRMPLPKLQDWYESIRDDLIFNRKHFLEQPSTLGELKGALDAFLKS